MRRMVPVIVLVLAVLVVAGVSVWSFSAAPAGIQAFAREQTAADRLPAGSADHLGVDPESTRFLVEHDGRAYFVGTGRRGPDGESTCLIVFAVIAPDDAYAGCTVGTNDLTLGTPLRHDVQLVQNDLNVERDGWRQLVPNLYVSE